MPASLRQLEAAGRAQEEAREPIPEAATEDEQMGGAELVEQDLGLPLLVLQAVQEFEQVLVADRVVRRRRGFPKEMEHNRLPQFRFRKGQVADGVRGVGDLLGSTEGVGEQRVEGERDEQTEARDARERLEGL